MASPTENRPELKPRKRLISLSVRALMVVVLILAAVLGWVVHRAQVQRDAVLAIMKTGGSVYYEWQRYPTGGPFPNPKGEPKWPKWLIESLGVDYFGHVAFVQLGKAATDADMVHVGRLPRLVSVQATNDGGITDAGAAHLAGLSDLEALSLMNTKVTGAALTNLKDKTKLQKLLLNNVPVTDADLENIKSLINLDILDLSGSKVGDAGLAHLEGMTKLKELRLNGTEVTGPGFAHLKGMTKLLWLRLSGSKVRDLSSLPPLPALMGIILEETPMDDAGLANLPDLPALLSIHLGKTAVTDAGLTELLRFQKTLNALALGGPKFTDAAAPTIAKLNKLMNLILNDTKVTDATLDQLSGLNGLKILDLDRTETTDAGLARLRKALPQLQTTKQAQAAARARMQAASKTPQKSQGAQP